MTKVKTNNLNWLLFQVAIQSKHSLMAIAEKYDLSVMQLYTLKLLDIHTSLPMNSLTTTLFCDASNVTGIVDKLLSKNLIRREENPEDRRVKIITLTSQGVKLCTKFSQEVENSLPKAFHTISETEKNQLNTIVTKMLLKANGLTEK